MSVFWRQACVGLRMRVIVFAFIERFSYQGSSGCWEAPGLQWVSGLGFRVWGSGFWVLGVSMH